MRISDDLQRKIKLLEDVINEIFDVKDYYIEISDEEAITIDFILAKQAKKGIFF